MGKEQAEDRNQPLLSDFLFNMHCQILSDLLSTPYTGNYDLHYAFLFILNFNSSS